jgi:hypothetical protein
MASFFALAGFAQPASAIIPPSDLTVGAPQSVCAGQPAPFAIVVFTSRQNSGDPIDMKLWWGDGIEDRYVARSATVPRVSDRLNLPSHTYLQPGTYYWNFTAIDRLNPGTASDHGYFSGVIKVVHCGTAWGGSFQRGVTAEVLQHAYVTYDPAGNPIYNQANVRVTAARNPARVYTTSEPVVIDWGDGTRTTIYVPGSAADVDGSAGETAPATYSLWHAYPDVGYRNAAGQLEANYLVMASASSQTSTYMPIVPTAATANVTHTC